METILKFNRLGYFTGRNGSGKQSGIQITNWIENIINIQPITSKGIPATCNITLPIENVEQFAANLLTFIQIPAIPAFINGDVIIEHYKGEYIINNPDKETGHHCLIIVNPLRGTRFIIGLDDSKNCGFRLDISGAYEEDLKACKEYIDYQKAD